MRFRVANKVHGLASVDSSRYDGAVHAAGDWNIEECMSRHRKARRGDDPSCRKNRIEPRRTRASVVGNQTGVAGRGNRNCVKNVRAGVACRSCQVVALKLVDVRHESANGLPRGRQHIESWRTRVDDVVDESFVIAIHIAEVETLAI